MPFRGYYRLGVCQDAVAAIEQRFYGSVTLFPITHDPGYFNGGSEIDKLFASLPDDRRNTAASWKRVRGSLPARDLSDVRIPQLRQTLLAFEAREDEISSERTIGIPAAIFLAAVIVSLLWWRRRKLKKIAAA